MFSKTFLEYFKSMKKFETEMVSFILKRDNTTCGQQKNKINEYIQNKFIVILLFLLQRQLLQVLLPLLVITYIDKYTTDYIITTKYQYIEC